MQQKHIYNRSLLKPEERIALASLILKFQKYDRLDILIEQIIDNPEEFLTREEIEKNKEEVIVQIMDESLKFCSGDKCMIDPLKE